jgi:steroid delta-isomerase-like uncharacterized protein
MAALTDEQKKQVVQRWFDAVNSRDVAALDEITSPNLIDHSGLSSGHAPGADGHKRLVEQLHSTFDDWSSDIHDISVEGDRVTVVHSGRGYYPAQFQSLMGSAAADPEMRQISFDIVSTLRLDDEGKIAEHWAVEGPLGRKATPGPLTDDDRRRIALRWFDAVNSGDWQIVDDIVSPDLIDHTGLSDAHGGGSEGHKRLVGQLRAAFPDWASRIDDVTVEGDVVTISHSGGGTYPQALAPLMGSPPTDAEMKRIDFTIVSKVRIDDSGKIVEHWAEQTPLGRAGRAGEPPPTPSWPTPTPPTPTPTPAPTPGPPGGTGTPDQNKQYLENLVHQVIDAQLPDRANEYYAENVLNHDPVPGEAPGRAGIVELLKSVFEGFTEFRTTIEQQVAEADIAAHAWWQTFKHTGTYLGVPPTGKQVDVSGITIARIRSGKIVEQWESRDVVHLLQQLGAPVPVGPLEDGEGTPNVPGGGSDEALKAVALSYFYDVWDSGNVGLIDQVFAQDYKNNNPLPGQQPGVAGVRQFVNRFRRAFPDCAVSVDLQLAEEDRVVTRYTVRGTHRDTFQGVAATGRPIQVSGIAIHRIAGGRIAEAWGYWDQASLLVQLGAFQFPAVAGPGAGAPPPGQPGPGQPGPGQGGQPGWG